MPDPSYYQHPWKRDYWNYTIIEGTNDQITNCGLDDSIEPLPQVPPNHVWSVEDVRKVREKLLEINPDLDDFSVPLTKWRGAILDEIFQMWDDAFYFCCSDQKVADARSLNGGQSYVPCQLGSPTVTVTFSGPPDNEYFYYIQQPYSWAGTIGQVYGIAGMSFVHHHCNVVINWQVDSDHRSQANEVGMIDTDKTGTVTSAPSGVLKWGMPSMIPLQINPATWTTTWETEGATCWT